MNLLKRDSVQQDILLISGNLSSKRGIRYAMICNVNHHVVQLKCISKSTGIYTYLIKRKTKLPLMAKQK